MLAFKVAEGNCTDEEIETMRIEFSHGAVKVETEEDTDESAHVETEETEE